MVEVWLLVVVGAVGAVLTIGVVWACWYFGAARRNARTLRAAPLVRIGDAREGVQHRIHGRASAWQQTLEAPLTGRPCVYYEATIEQLVYRHRKDLAGDWVRIAHEVVGVPFLVEDATGRAIVDPSGAIVELTVDAGMQAGPCDHSTHRMRAFVERYYLEPTTNRSATELRYREGVVEVGESITVLGAGVREPDPDAAGKVGGYRDAAPMRLRLSGNAARPLYLTDRAVTG
jgi:hypothetical protein